MCGATGAQNNLQSAQTAFYSTLTSEYQQTYGENQAILGALTSSFEPILAAGPNQQGFSQGELNSLNTQATTSTGQNYNAAEKALAVEQGAVGGGNVVVPTGANTQMKSQLLSSAAQQESAEQTQIQQADWQTGLQNYWNAAGALSGVLGETNPAGMANAATGAGSAASTTANEIAQENNSWMGLVSGALGATGTALGGGSLGKLITGGGSGTGNTSGT